MPTFEKDFSRENILAYAKACLDISSHLDVLHEEGFESIIIPSRGSYLIYTSTMLFREREFDKRNGFLYLPYTSETVGRITPENSRKYWNQVLRDLLNGHASLNTLWYEYLQVLSKSNPDSFKPMRIVGNKIVFIDTVVSGRASSKILRDMDELGLNYHALLIVDNMGNDMKHLYQEIIEEKVAARKATLITVPSIFTEDRGAAALGINSYIFPSLMEHAQEVFGVDDIGAGIFAKQPRVPRRVIYSGTRFDEYSEESLNDNCILHFHLIEDLVMEGIMGQFDENAREFIGDIDDLRETLLSLTRCFDYLSPATTRKCVDEELEGYKALNADFEVTGSHVIRVHFPKDVTERLVREFWKQYLE